MNTTLFSLMFLSLGMGSVFAAEEKGDKIKSRKEQKRESQRLSADMDAIIEHAETIVKANVDKKVTSSAREIIKLAKKHRA